MVSLALTAAAAPRAVAEDARVPGPADFHHTEWTGIGSVFDIKQSADGFLWLTTSKGVFRFDGVRFQSVEEATLGAAHANEIDSVFLSKSGGLWLSTESAGLLFWKDGALTEVRDRRCTPTRKQGKVIEDSDGSLWVQGAAGLFHFKGRSCEQMGVKQGYPGGFAAGILMDRDGTLWVKTRTGPLLFLPKGQSKFRASESGDGKSSSYAFLHESPDGAIWLSDDQGLRRVTSKPGAPAFSEPRAKASRKISQFGDFAFASDGSLWAVNATGVQRFQNVAKWTAPRAAADAPGETFSTANGLSSDAAWKVLIDREGMVWVGTNSGLDRLRRNVISTLPLPRVQEHEFSIAAGDAGSLWIGNSDTAHPYRHWRRAYPFSRNGSALGYPERSRRNGLARPAPVILICGALPARDSFRSTTPMRIWTPQFPLRWIFTTIPGSRKKRACLSFHRRCVAEPEPGAPEKAGSDRRHGG